MDYATGINPETLEKCTLSQACEFMAWGWQPVDKFADTALGYAENRTKAKENHDSYWSNQMNIATGKIQFWLHAKELTISGINKSRESVIPTLSDNFTLDIENNSITDGKNIYTNIEVDFYTLQHLFGRTTPKLTYTMTLNDDTISLIIENIAKIKIKKLTKNTKNGRIISYVMEHPNTLFSHSDLNKLQISNFDKADRIDQIFTNAFSKDIANLFFERTSDSVKFTPKVTDIDVKKHDIKLLTIE